MYIEAFKELQKISLGRLGYAYCRCEMHPIKEKEKMEFDKSKILTVVTADQLREGQLGWVENTIPDLAESVKDFKPYYVCKNDGDNRLEYPFICNVSPKRYFYPAPEPTYAERQAEWVKENNVKGGTKVRVTRTFTEDEDGSCCWKHDDLVGMTGTVDEYGITSYNLGITMSDGSRRSIPYFALEVIKEPTYRPYNNDELNDLVGEVLTNKQSGRKKLVTGKPTASEGVNLDGSYISAKDLLASFYRNTDKPCGVREEA